MSRTEDIVLIRAEVAHLNGEDRHMLLAAAHTTDHEELAATIQRFRLMSYELHKTPEHVRSGACTCLLCRFGRHLDDAGLL